MTATVILAPARAAEVVCHEEQRRVWAHELVLAFSEYFRDNLDGSDIDHIHRLAESEVTKIVESAFDHPAARTIMRK